MNIHILGVGGTFMAGIARLAQQLGHSVTGSEKKKIYPPMSTQIEKLKIAVNYGYLENSIPENTDLVIIGNSLSRGQPIEWKTSPGLEFSAFTSHNSFKPIPYV